MINAASGANITCTFVTQRAGQIIGGSYNDHNHNHVRNNNDEWLSGWQIQTHSAQTQEVATQTTGVDGRTTFTNVRPGSYTVCTTVRSGWYNIGPGVVDVRYGQPCYTITVDPGMAVWVRFGNSTTPLVTVAGAVPLDSMPLNDVAVCALVATDDAGNLLGLERDLWEEEEAATTNTIYLPLVIR